MKGFRMLIMECKFQDVWKDEIGEQEWKTAIEESACQNYDGCMGNINGWRGLYWGACLRI